jgi:hypothetical protein
MEPVYTDIDEDGSPLGIQQRPKWMSPKNPLAIHILSAVGRKYYHTRSEQFAVNEIVKSSLSLTTDRVESPYPKEWVEFCCLWAEKKRDGGRMVQLDGLMSFIMNADRRRVWLDVWTEEHGKVEDTI